MSNTSMFRRLALGLAALVLSGTGFAQTLSVAQFSFVRGQTYEIEYTNPAQAGQSVKIECSGTDPVSGLPEVSTYTIKVDSTGRGILKFWAIVEWNYVRFNVTGAQELARQIN